MINAIEQIDRKRLIKREREHTVPSLPPLIIEDPGSSIMKWEDYSFEISVLIRC